MTRPPHIGFRVVGPGWTRRIVVGSGTASAGVGFGSSIGVASKLGYTAFNNLAGMPAADMREQVPAAVLVTEQSATSPSFRCKIFS